MGGESACQFGATRLLLPVSHDTPALTKYDTIKSKLA
ncbi:hypothetical protein PoMZ_07670 [Pyricularia oryzae]|uniref:Uncharacterized protein n=1 Tax=Pyricularia oryzae TaxID=318829 RepID=A0A4V1C6Q7_PYROR|nr:hypothetical protein PoMZ_07670 [Pyricularia oryzae]